MTEADLAAAEVWDRVASGRRGRAAIRQGMVREADACEAARPRAPGRTDEGRERVKVRDRDGDLVEVSARAASPVLRSFGAEARAVASAYAALLEVVQKGAGRAEGGGGGWSGISDGGAAAAVEWAARLDRVRAAVGTRVVTVEPGAGMALVEMVELVVQGGSAPAVLKACGLAAGGRRYASRRLRVADLVAEGLTRASAGLRV